MKKARYARHLALPDFDESHQLLLANARVLVVGAGGLGAPILQYLAAAGVGHLGIADPDRVSLSNLQRQVLFSDSDVGKLKVEQTAKRIQPLNPEVTIKKYPLALTAANALEIIEDYDLVVDATDNFPTRYLLNDACVLSGRAYVYGSIYRYEGQVSVFNGLLPDGSRGPNYRDLFPEPPPPDQVPDCAEGGVIGALPGIIGSVQALEVIKLICGLGDPLIGKLWMLDAAYMETQLLRIPSGRAPRIIGLIDYDAFCGLDTTPNKHVLSPELLRDWMRSSKPFRLIDIRKAEERGDEPWESEHIPNDQIGQHKKALLDSPLPVVFFCQSGRRSAAVLSTMLAQAPEGAFYHLEGGLKKWFRAGF